MMPSGMVFPLRVIINDLDGTSYSDTRLSQVLTVGSQYVQQDIGIAIYTLDVSNYTISPDPTDPSTLNQNFVNLAVLKSACFIDQGSLRTQAAAAGLRAALGPLSLDTSSSNRLEGFIKLFEDGPCKLYQDLLAQYMLGNTNILQAILTPFIHNQFDPRLL